MIHDRILVVDDSLQNRMVARGHLEAEGYLISEASCGESALELLALEGADLVLLDVRMPGIDGFETCRRLRATPSLADIPVLFLTAYGDRESTAPALEAGGDDLLPKPFHRVELLLRIRALIRLRRQTVRLAQQQQQLRRISQLIVHDLRGPMGAILANADMLREAGAEGELVDDIAFAVEHMDRTVRDLLECSRAEEVGMTPRPVEFDLAAVASEVEQALRGHARARQVVVQLAIGVRAMFADPALVRRLLQNLIHNAIRYAPPGSAVTVAAIHEGDGVLLRVLDEGSGVPAADRERIFEPYVSRGSSGLGLVLCRMVALAHGGRIWVEDRAPHGAAFCAWFPAARLQVVPQAEDRVRARPVTRSSRASWTPGSARGG